MADDTAADPTLNGTSSCSRVLSTTELLESILIQLPLGDLLHAQKVSREFKNGIERSPRLQQALFFRPGPGSFLRYLDHGAAVFDCQVYTRCDRMNSTRPEQQGTARRWAQDATGLRGPDAVILNPLVLKKMPWIFDNSLYRPRPKPVSHMGTIQPTASWWNMLFTQPAISEVVVDFGYAYHWHRVTADAKDGGVTVGKLYESAWGFGKDMAILLHRETAYRALESAYPFTRSIGVTAVEVLEEVNRSVRRSKAS